MKPDDVEAHYNRGLAYYKKHEYRNAVKDYTKAIGLNPNIAAAYHNRGEAWLHLGEWNKARADLALAKEKGVDIAAAFHNDYESVSDFEQKNDEKLPEDIAEMLTP